MNIQEKLLPVPSKRRPGTKIDPIYYIVAHDTGNDGSTAAGNVSYYTQSAYEVEASAHAFVDDLGAIWCIPKTEVAWHVRKNAGIAPNIEPTLANHHALGIELCFGSKWDDARNKLAYRNYVELIASLCDEFKLDPEKSIIAHGTLDPTRRTDPFNAFGYINVTWEQFIAGVKDKIKPISQEEMVCIPIKRSMLDQIIAFLKSL